MEWLIVQLEGRAKVESRILWWLNSDDALAVGQQDRIFDDSSLVFVHVNAAFRSQHLLQALLCARLRRWGVFRCSQEAWLYDNEDYNSAGSDHPHDNSIHVDRKKLSGTKFSFWRNAHRNVRIRHRFSFSALSLIGILH